MLESGRIRKVTRTRNGAPAQAEYTRWSIDITDSFFTGTQPGYTRGYNTPGERGWVLGHELGHLVQMETGTLRFEIGDARVRSNQGRILRMFYNQSKREDPLLQGDANGLGCSLALQPGTWAGACHP